jgi:N6-adenosine-specific RNA methylase IME4/ParB-like chromosome segregation protein Spo0J
MMTDHPIANIFPLMSDEEIKELAEDIREHGQKSPILTYENQILDGRNRYRACVIAGVDPVFEEYAGSSPVIDVLSWNLHRRHLTVGQRAMVATEVLPFLEKEAKKRQLATLKQNTDRAKVPQRKGRARDQAAKQLSVSGRLVQDAKKLKAEHPEIAEEVKRGALTLAKAKKQVARKAYQQRVSRSKTILGQVQNLMKTEYDLVLADPPWQYDFSETEARAVENHYDTLDVEEICKQAPANLAKDCILFLWATAPKLVEALTVIERWGFTYRSHAVWDKKLIGMGYWFRGRHEVLLVGTKGRPGAVPEAARVASIFEEARGEHSAKPEVVYKWIDQAFPMACKLEMYSRRTRYGWRTIGNELPQTEEAA